MVKTNSVGRTAMSETTKALQTGAATGGVRMLLRLEGLTLLPG